MSDNELFFLNFSWYYSHMVFKHILLEPDRYSGLRFESGNTFSSVSDLHVFILFLLLNVAECIFRSCVLEHHS